LGGTLAFMAKDFIAPQSLLLFAPGGLRVANARREAVLSAMAEGRHGEGSAVYEKALKLALDVDLEGRLAANQTPTDVVWGEDDRVFSGRTRTRFMATIKNAELHLLPSIGHFAPLEAPEAIARIIERRLASLGIEG
jgi:pimeloyl-ACP methyl ester carboxylesterase